MASHGLHSDFRSGSHPGASMAQLFERLVPPLGAASTVQGELVRAFAALEYEYVNNGNANWKLDRQTFEGHIDTLRAYLHSIPGRSDADIAAALSCIEAAGRSRSLTARDSAQLEQALRTISLAVRDWVENNPTPRVLPNEEGCDQRRTGSKKG